MQIYCCVVYATPRLRDHAMPREETIEKIADLAENFLIYVTSGLNGHL